MVVVVQMILITCLVKQLGHVLPGW